MTILLDMKGWDPHPWIAAIKRADPERQVVTAVAQENASAIRYAWVWRPRTGILSNLPNLELIVNLGAGVDALLADATIPTHVPIVRALDPNITMRMTEWIVLQVLYHHRHIPAYLEQQRQRIWRALPQPAASAVTVGILGCGALGTSAGVALRHVGFEVIGWSRTAKEETRFKVFAGGDCLPSFLGQTDILVCLLPLTPETRGVLSYGLFRQLKRGGALAGPVLVNAGRGAQQIDADILRALDDGTLWAASLDVFDPEPLALTSQLWAHPRAFVTPHIAADSEPEAMSGYVIKQIRRHEQGLPLDMTVDRGRGY
jgi:glyoxylate/hydroxypyruvate reductase A